MFSKKITIAKLKKNLIENEMLQMKIDFYECMSDEDEDGNFGFTDNQIDFVISYQTTISKANETEIEVMEEYIQKIKKLEEKFHSL